MRINFITSSQNKVDEVSRVLGTDHELVRVHADLIEIQHKELQEIIREKLEVARTLFPNQLIIVEDTSFEVDAMGGKPGTFIKFYEEEEPDSEMSGNQRMYLMARGVQPEGDLTARAKVMIGLSDQAGLHYFEGVLEGTIVSEHGEGWGFDKIFIPNGYDQRLGTLGQEIKAQISHRSMAVKSLKKYLDSLA